MFQLQVTVIHALGRFTGYLQLDDPETSENDVRELNDGLQRTINNLERLVLVQNDGTEIVFQKTIIRDAIFVFDVVEL